ncbi:MAG TPA: hypothetical protein VGG61_07435 [Gemmataceae bacterium]|jgi:uncharacterized protein (DUF433 family)
MSTPTKTWLYLERDPKSSYQQLSIKGRRIKARTLYGLTQGEEAMTPEEVAADRDLPLEAVLEAIAYCETNPPEIREDFEREERLDEAMGFNDPEYKRTGKTRLLTAQELARIRRP